MKADIEAWKEEYAVLPEARAHLDSEINAAQERMRAAADYGHYVVARERTKAVLRAMWEFECKLKHLVPLNDTYSRRR